MSTTDILIQVNCEPWKIKSRVKKRLIVSTEFLVSFDFMKSYVYIFHFYVKYR